MASSVLVGTASWTDKPLVQSGKFYPPGATSAEARLRHYASVFSLVEADSSYYALPRPEVSKLWVARTPDNFRFDIKAFALFTEHPTATARLPKDAQAMLPAEQRAKRNVYRKDAPPDLLDYCWSSFVDALAPLHDAGKLGVVVFQFPKWVFPNHRTWGYFEEIKRRLGPYRGAVEFRNDVWMRADNREGTLARLGELEFTYVCVDEPQGFRSSVPPVVAATADLAFVRFHGRNRATWERRTKTSAERFDYRYEVSELDEWVQPIRELLGQASEVHAIMNTNNDDQGPANAILLREQLHAAGIPVR